MAVFWVPPVSPIFYTYDRQRRLQELTPLANLWTTVKFIAWYPWSPSKFPSSPVILFSHFHHLCSEFYLLWYNLGQFFCRHLHKIFHCAIWTTCSLICKTSWSSISLRFSPSPPCINRNLALPCGFVYGWRKSESENTFPDIPNNTQSLTWSSYSINIFGKNYIASKQTKQSFRSKTKKSYPIE